MQNVQLCTINGNSYPLFTLHFQWVNQKRHAAVFLQGGNTAQEWHDRLSNAPNLSKKEQHKLAKDYCHAIAREIVSKTTDEELNRWN